MDTVKVMRKRRRRAGPAGLFGLQDRDYRALPRLFRRRRLLVIGCGDIGQRIAALVRRDWRVFGVARSAATLERTRAAGAVPLAADATRRRLQDLADWVVYAAPPSSGGQTSPDTPNAAGPAIDRLVRTWTGRLLRRPRWSKRHGDRQRRPKRLVYLSTTGVYGDRQGQATPEETPLRPSTERARRRVDAERWLRHSGHDGRKLRVTILRVPGIYAIDRLPIRRLQARLPALLPRDDVQTNHIHARDLARLARAALLRGRAQRVLNAVDDSALPMGDYLELVARWAGLPLPPRVDRATLLATVSAMRASFMSESRRLSNRRMKNELRVRLRYPTVADFLAAHQPPGWLSAAAYIMPAKPV
jgi:nucleoside-diphosphate-sugar epimerase